ncbi:MAG: hypothetical protein LBP22_03795 [Deltaproteobacteria bacterium]|jgi:hypothetical protein|nr:hypothetical protein [Deltaproteobacteria bacterium]
MDKEILDSLESDCDLTIVTLQKDDLDLSGQVFGPGAGGDDDDDDDDFDDDDDDDDDFDDDDDDDFDDDDDDDDDDGDDYYVDDDDEDIEVEAYATLVLNMKLQPMHRFEYIEEELDRILGEPELGYTAGGGTMVMDNGEVEMCEVEMDLFSAEEEDLKQVLSLVKELPLAKGSILKMWAAGDDRTGPGEVTEYPVGDMEGLAIYLNGQDLPEKVYRNNTPDEIIEALEKALSANGPTVYSYWEGPSETALYFYSNLPYSQMLKLAEPIIAKNPLCQKCRVDQVA